MIFAGSANLSGEQRAPLHAGPYVFSADWIGGPDIGYMRTNELEDALSRRLQVDLTVQAAVAVSGAAFASSMGRQGRWYATLLAVTGVRLGTWLPNPVYIAARNAALTADDWTFPQIPHVRRVPYLLRELFGIHQYSDRLLQITDGGHYENLGLVEILRRRCKTIYCVDASGDTPPTAGTLEQALRIAYAELGVTVKWNDDHDPWDLGPGSAEDADQDEASKVLSGRLARRAVLEGTVTYPKLDEARPEFTGRLIFVKTVLTSDMDYELLSYAARNPSFPCDSTSDQFFDDDRFCAYRALGRELGRLAADPEPAVEPPVYA